MPRPVVLRKWPTSCRPSCCCYRFAFAQKTSEDLSTKPISDVLFICAKAKR